MKRRMNKKDKQKIVAGTLLGFAFLVAIMLLLPIAPPATAGPTTTTTLPGGGNGGGSSSGGGGGGGSGGGDGGGGTTPPDGGFLCETCGEEYLEGNPGLITKNTPAGKSFLDDLLLRINPPKPGHWNCVGPCVYNGVDVSDSYNCVPNPNSEVPEGGYDDYFGEKPACWCLLEKPGNCNWYDSNFGEGVDQLTCGGRCPPGQTCKSWLNPNEKKEHCECVATDGDQLDCGFHYPPDSIRIPVGDPDYCYGDCPKGQECIYTPASLGTQSAQCGCGYIEDGQEPEPDDAIPCEGVDTQRGLEWWRCYESNTVCDRPDLECAFNPHTLTCGCQSKTDCGLHLTGDQVKELRSMYGGDFYHAFMYVGGSIMYCYGDCPADLVYRQCEPTYFKEATIDGFDCKCIVVTYPTTTTIPIPSGLPVGDDYLNRWRYY